MRALFLVGVLVVCAPDGLARGCPVARDLSDLQEAEPDAAVIVVAQQLGDRFLVREALKGAPRPTRIAVAGVDVAIGETALLLLTPTRGGYTGVQVGWAVRSFPVVGGNVRLGSGALPLSTLAVALGLRPAPADLGIDWQRTIGYVLLFGAMAVVGFELGRRRPRR